VNTQPTSSLRTLLLAFPDNPIGTVFLDAFREEGIPLIGILVETQGLRSNWKRIRMKIQKDGIRGLVRRTAQMAVLRIRRRTPVALARRLGIPVHFVGRFNSPECSSLIESLSVDVLAIASAPVLKPFIFEKARIACLNAHPGWLPRYRGLGANRAALLAGDRPGISVHYVDSGIDTGRIIVREWLDVYRGDDLASLNDRAVRRGSVLMARVIRRLHDGPVEALDIRESVGKCHSAGKYSELRRVRRAIRRLSKKRQDPAAEAGS
jgi:folate-dependent phosphoribosylglycinamide formyltransferase PurN